MRMADMCWNMLVMHKDDLPLIVNRTGEVDFQLLRPEPGLLAKSATSQEEDLLAARSAFDGDWGPACELMDHREQNNTVSELNYSLVNGTFVHIVDPEIADYVRFGSLLYSARAKCGFDTQYEWRCNNWGTKWNARGTTIAGPDSSGQVFICFKSAWDVPNADMIADLRAACQREATLYSLPPHESGLVKNSCEVIGPASIWDDVKESFDHCLRKYGELDFRDDEEHGADEAER